MKKAQEPQDQTTLEIVCVTPDMARRYLEMAAYPLQRPLRDAHVDEYAYYMRNGTWRDNTVLRFNVVEDLMFLIDGQHRLHALIQANRPQYFVILTERVKTMDEVEKNYIWTDMGSLRTMSDVIRTMDLHDKYNVATTRIRQIREGARIIRADFVWPIRATRLERHDRELFTKDVETWIEIGRKYLGMVIPKVNRFGGGLSRAMVTPGIMAVGMVTVLHQWEMANTFWQSVAQNDGLRAQSPEAKLATFLLTNKPIDQGMEVFTRKVAACWNAYYRGETSYSAIYARSEHLPILIEGTPWKG